MCPGILKCTAVKKNRELLSLLLYRNRTQTARAAPFFLFLFPFLYLFSSTSKRQTHLVFPWGSTNQWHKYCSKDVWKDSKLFSSLGFSRKISNSSSMIERREEKIKKKKVLPVFFFVILKFPAAH